MTARPPRQLALFSETGATKRAPARRQLSLKASQQASLAAITELFYAENYTSVEAAERARRLLVDLTPAGVREAAVEASWLAASYLRQIDRMVPGMAVEMLQEWGFIVARSDLD